MATVLVIDPAPGVRETLRIVLGHEHEVIVAPTLAEVPSGRRPDVAVLGLPAPPRDERTIGATLGRALPRVPMLLLHAARDVDARALVRPEVPVAFLPKPFDAYAVRARIRTLLAARPRVPSSEERLRLASRRLEVPFLAPATAAVARRVLMADPPIVLLQGPPGTGGQAVARALHVVRGERGPFVTVDAACLGGGELADRVDAAGDAVTTLYVAHLDRASAEVQGDVSRLIEERALDGGPGSVRLIVGAEQDLCALAAASRFSSELAYVASALPLVLVPLRDRPDDVPALVELLTPEVGARLRLEAVTYRPETLERLRHYLWFGDLAELEAVLTRTLVLHRPSVVDPDQLVFLPEAAARALTERTPAPAPIASVASPAPSAALASLDLEVVLGELAHELRNPMVTIKTVAQHLDGVLADPEARARFSVLMSEAVGRMDGLLETLLDFSRFRDPVARAIDVEKILDQVLGEHAEELRRRHVRVEHNGSGVGPVHADEGQVVFALRSLCRGLVSDLVPHTTLAVHGVAPGVLEMRVRAEPSIAARLTAWVAPHASGATEHPPLTWALAAALLERNGGALTVHKGEDETTVIRVEWTKQAE